MYRHCVITGASSGVGAALAERYAAPGITLGLLGRDAERLERAAARCRTKGAVVETGSVDVRDAGAMRAWLEAFDDAHPVDLLIANAGVSGGTAEGMETLAGAQAIFAANWDGVLHTVFPLLERMQARRAGQIGIMASLAGYRGLPGAPAYSASKAAARVWGEALRGLLHPDGVGVSVICPGFVRTPMTAVNRYPMPFLMDADRAARIIARGLERNAARIAFPWPMALFMGLMMALPPAATDLFFRRLPAKS